MRRFFSKTGAALVLALGMAVFPVYADVQGMTAAAPVEENVPETPEEEYKTEEKTEITATPSEAMKEEDVLPGEEADEFLPDITLSEATPSNATPSDAPPSDGKLFDAERMEGNLLKLPLPERTGYTFVEWNTMQDGTGEGFDAGDVVEITAGTLYAVWEENTATPSEAEKETGGDPELIKDLEIPSDTETDGAGAADGTDSPEEADPPAAGSTGDGRTEGTPDQTMPAGKEEIFGEPDKATPSDAEKPVTGGSGSQDETEVPDDQAARTEV